MALAVAFGPRPDEKNGVPRATMVSRTTEGARACDNGCTAYVEVLSRLDRCRPEKSPPDSRPRIHKSAVSEPPNGRMGMARRLPRRVWLVSSCLALSSAPLAACSNSASEDDSRNPGSGGAATTGGGSSMETGGSTSGGGSSSAAGGSASAGGTGTDSGGSQSGAGGTTPLDPTCAAGIQNGTPKVLALSGNTFAHDPTMIKVGGTYYRFWTGSRIPSSTSTDLTHWVNAPSVYGNTYSSWTTTWLAGIPGNTFGFPWAPDVSTFDDRVHIYSSFSAKFGDNISCITHLSTPDITSGNWTDHGPVICTKGNESYNAIDADVGFDVDGAPYLSFGSFWDGIQAFELNPDGSRKGTELTRLAWAPQIEAPVMFHRCGYYYLLVTWGLCCPGEGRSVDDLTYRVVAGRSENILGPYVDKNGTPMLSGGGTLIVEGDGVNWAAAGHSDVLFDGDDVYHLYHGYAQSNGAASLRIAEMMFDSEGWPVPHAP